MNFLRSLYILALGLSLTFAVAFGISTFYQAPQYEAPQMGPSRIEPPRKVESLATPPPPESPEFQKWQQEQWELEEKNAQEWSAFEAARKSHSRNVFFIAYPFSLLFIALGSVTRGRPDIIGAGLILGGIGTMIYAMAQGNLANEWRFAGSAVGSAVLIYLGYRFLIEKKPGEAG